MCTYTYAYICMYYIHIQGGAAFGNRQQQCWHRHLVITRMSLIPKNITCGLSLPPLPLFLALSRTHAHARMQVAHFCGESLDEIQQYLNELGEPYLVEAIDTKGIFNF